MGRVIAIGAGGKAQAPERDDRFGYLIDAFIARGLLGRKVLSPVCKDWAHADDVRRALNRSARHYCSCGRVSCTRRHKNYVIDGLPGGCPHGGQRVSSDAKVVTDKQGKYRVQLTLRDKREGMQHVINKYGPDPANWPYNPRAKNLRQAANGTAPM